MSLNTKQNSITKKLLIRNASFQLSHVFTDLFSGTGLDFSQKALIQIIKGIFNVNLLLLLIFFNFIIF